MLNASYFIYISAKDRHWLCLISLWTLQYSPFSLGFEIFFFCLQIVKYYMNILYIHLVHFFQVTHFYIPQWCKTSVPVPFTWLLRGSHSRPLIIHVSPFFFFPGVCLNYFVASLTWGEQNSTQHSGCGHHVHYEHLHAVFCFFSFHGNP